MSPEAEAGTLHLEDFDRKLRIRLAGWLSSLDGKEYAHSERIRLVPDLLRTGIRLLLDERLPAGFRPLLLSAVIYVVSASDMVPEELVGPVGFADDLVLMALVLHRLLGELPGNLMAEAWSGEGDLASQLEDVLGSAEDIVGGPLLLHMRSWVGVD